MTGQPGPVRRFDCVVDFACTSEQRAWLKARALENLIPLPQLIRELIRDGIKYQDILAEIEPAVMREAVRNAKGQVVGS